ncbi:MAG TPA: glycosyltransferase family 2 protein, partial [Methanosarcinales archaeon]|nr:glycosyltransferase family 2 protein [Methanosarcinales archaeon]
SMFGLIEKFKNKKDKLYIPEKRFAIFIPAHNEEVVISSIVENLKHINYPEELYDVFVVADNCTDKTADTAANAGAKVLVRFDDADKGKGHALKWAFETVLFSRNKNYKYDAAVIFDADNLVAKDFLWEMNNKLCAGHKVVQGFIDSKNPNDSWITLAYSVSFWSVNRLFQSARCFLGLSNEIGGTGFCMDVQVLKKMGWEATSLAEDLEFTAKLVLNGFKVAWAPNAIIYDEKPLTLMQSWKQRRRWMQGFADVCSRYFFVLLKKGVKEGDLAAIDCAIYTLQPYVLILGGIMLLLPFANILFFEGDLFILTTNISTAFFFYVGMIQLLLLPISLIVDKRFTMKMLLFYPAYAVFCLTWIPIAVEGIVKMKNKDWSHTLHTRTLSIQEIE